MIRGNLSVITVCVCRCTHARAAIITFVEARACAKPARANISEGFDFEGFRRVIGCVREEEERCKRDVRAWVICVKGRTGFARIVKVIIAA